MYLCVRCFVTFLSVIQWLRFDKTFKRLSIQTLEFGYWFWVFAIGSIDWLKLTTSNTHIRTQNFSCPKQHTFLRRTIQHIGTKIIRWKIDCLNIFKLHTSWFFFLTRDNQHHSGHNYGNCQKITTSHHTKNCSLAFFLESFFLYFLFI